MSASRLPLFALLLGIVLALCVQRPVPASAARAGATAADSAP